MTATVSYELHVMRSGRWVTSGIYQDKSEALRDARGPMRKRYLGIRVIEEIFDPERDRFVTRTVYRDSSKVDEGGHESTAASGFGPVLADDCMDVGGAALRKAGMTVVGISAALLAGIGGMFWFGLV